MRSLFAVLMVSTFAMTSQVGCAAPSSSDEGVAEAAITGQDRGALMDALRAKVKPDLGNQDIVFDVSKGSLRVAGGYAFLMGRIALRGGGEPTTAGTVYEEAAREGMFDGFRVEALLQKQGESWLVLEHGIGTTDVWYQGIEERHAAAPTAIFPWLDGDGSQQVAPSERMAIMNGLRARVKPELGNQDIVFDVSQGAFRVGDGYCWLQGTIQLRDGSAPTTAGTVYEEAAREGMFDGFRIEALLQKQGESWVVLAHGIGSTDVWYAGLAEQHPEATSVLPALAGAPAE